MKKLISTILLSAVLMTSPLHAVFNGSFNAPAAGNNTSTTISWVSTLSGAVYRYISDLFQERVSVKDFGAKGDGSTDDTAAIQAAFTATPNGGAIFFPAGTYKVTSPIVCASNNTRVYGAGKMVTNILFVPSTGNQSCFRFCALANAMLFTDEMRDLSIISNDTTHVKQGLELVNASNFVLENVRIAATAGTYYFVDNTVASKGLWIRGHDSIVVNNCDLWADLPLYIDRDPIPAYGGVYIDLDHANFHNLYTACSTSSKNITIVDGCNISNVSFDGYQAWNHGSYGVYWNDTTTTQIGYSVSFKNVRHERPDGGGYMFYISHNYDLLNLYFENVYGATQGSAGGYYLRKIQGCTWNDCFLSGAVNGTYDINADTTCESFRFQNMMVRTNPNISMTAVNVSGDVRSFQPNTTYPYIDNYYIPNATKMTVNPSVHSTSPISQYEPPAYTVTASGGTFNIGGSQMCGILCVSEYTATGASALIELRGGSSPHIISDTSSDFSITKDTANKFCIYWDATQTPNVYVLQNNFASNAQIRFTLIGKGEHY